MTGHPPAGPGPQQPQGNPPSGGLGGRQPHGPGPVPPPQPPYQQPSASQPPYQQPSASQPPYQQPSASQPPYQQPSASQPPYQQPTAPPPPPAGSGGPAQPGHQPPAGQQGYQGPPPGGPQGGQQGPVGGPPQQKSRLGLILGIVGGVVALAIVITMVLVFVVFTSRPTDAVEQYFDAIRAGDADTALSFVSAEPGNSDLLTDEVLQKSNELAPITDVRVIGATDSAAEVELEIDGRTEEVRYEVEQVDGEWKLSGGVFQLSITGADEDSPMVVNGVTADPTQVWIFPGTYEFAAGNDNLAWGPESTLTLLGGTVQTPTSLQLAPTDAGEEAARTAINASMQACAEQQSLQAEGCPFQQQPPAGVEVDESTISWGLSDDPASGWVPQAPNGPVLSGEMAYQIRLRYTFTQGGQTYPYDQRASLRIRVSTDLSADPITVRYGN